MELQETAQARERVMLDRLCEAVKAFYEDPNNKEAYLAYKEAHRNDQTGQRPNIGEG